VATGGDEVLAATPALAVNHVGITVPDIHAAIDWYQAVFGFRCIMGPRRLRANSAATAETRSVLGPEFVEALQAHLLTANGVGLELFQFIDPPVEGEERGLGYQRRGPWHVCFTHPDLEAGVAQLIEKGGVQTSPISNFVPGRPWQLVYCRDPWGTVIELMSHSYAEVFSNWPQPGMTQETEWVKAQSK
jgi:catechol 2,3-dioxygenase-like lactoylglutathione lyase family enzyme